MPNQWFISFFPKKGTLYTIQQEEVIKRLKDIKDEKKKSKVRLDKIGAFLTKNSDTK